MKETATEVLQILLNADREAFLREQGGRKNGYYEVAIALYAAGVTQRKAAEVMSLLLGHRYTHETLSNLRSCRRRSSTDSGPCPRNWPSSTWMGCF